MRMLKKIALTLPALLLVLLLCTNAFAMTITVTSDPVETGATNATIYYTITNEHATATMENITISNAYNIAFDLTGVTIQANGGYYQGTTQAVVNDEMIGQTITLQIAWNEVDATAGTSTPKTSTAKLVLKRPSTAGFTATRTASNRQASPGEVITLTYTVTNTGMVTLKKLAITDTNIAGKTPIAKEITLAPGEVYTCTYDYKMGYETVISAPVITYTEDGSSTERTYSGIAELTLGMINADLDIDVVQGTSTENGVQFTLTLMNDGNQSIKSIRIKDELGNAVNEETFSLAIGESRTLTYTVSTDELRNVVFYINGYTSADEPYEDNTKSYTVRKYIDPSLLGIEFSAAVTETLNAEGSISVRFTINNTGTMDMANLVLSETEQGELKRVDTISPGEHNIDQTVFVGEPRNLVFTLEMTDSAGNPYTYTANITADYVGVSVASADGDGTASITTLGGNLGARVTSTLRGLFIVLIILCSIFGIAFIALAVLERKRRAELKRKRAQKERLERKEQRRAQTGASTTTLTGAGDTRTRMGNTSYTGAARTAKTYGTNTYSGNTRSGSTRAGYTRDPHATVRPRETDDRPDPKL